jgi:diguanylate cyclase (GGDEF)-like protein
MLGHYLPSMAASYDNKGKPRSFLNEAFSLARRGRKSHIPDRIAMLGIPEDELSESVTLAISALFEKMDDMQLELNNSRTQLEELQTLVDVDCLAPIPNRRAFMRRLQWVVSMQERYNDPSSIVYFDLSRFKFINDTYGHAAGDAAIRHVAEILNGFKRDSDFMARLGGDEFAIILYYADEDVARRRAEQIAEKIRSTPYVFNGQSIHVNTSFGFHAILKGETAEQALHEADQSMYRNKQASRQLTPASTIDA